MKSETKRTLAKTLDAINGLILFINGGAAYKTYENVQSGEHFTNPTQKISPLDLSVAVNVGCTTVNFGLLLGSYLLNRSASTRTSYSYSEDEEFTENETLTGNSKSSCMSSVSNMLTSAKSCFGLFKKSPQGQQIEMDTNAPVISLSSTTNNTDS